MSRLYSAHQYDLPPHRLGNWEVPDARKVGSQGAACAPHVRPSRLGAVLTPRLPPHTGEDGPPGSGAQERRHQADRGRPGPPPRPQAPRRLCQGAPGVGGLAPALALAQPRSQRSQGRHDGIQGGPDQLPPQGHRPHHELKHRCRALLTQLSSRLLASPPLYSTNRHYCLMKHAFPQEEQYLQLQGPVMRVRESVAQLRQQLIQFVARGSHLCRLCGRLLRSSRRLLVASPPVALAATIALLVGLALPPAVPVPVPVLVAVSPVLAAVPLPVPLPVPVLPARG